jgi:hypothetical protein
MQDDDRSSAPGDMPAPVTEVFRAWVQDSLAILGVSASSVARDLHLGKNTIGDFLRDPARNIYLQTAHDITCRLREIAADQGKSLPVLEVHF